MFYVIRMYEKKDGTRLQTVQAFETLHLAEIRYFQVLFADIGNADVTHCFATMLNPDGSVNNYHHEYIAEAGDDVVKE